ncbi:pilus assembly FimT family protein [Marinobacter persicus]|nr:type II secretion system protein [Marinobacter persicus]GHD48980.1 hypothetical protein GCM10008110_18400 [Marinobacter persicus]
MIRRCGGFTIIELIMVIILIGVLSALGIGLFARSSAFSPLLATQQLQSATLLAQQAALAGKYKPFVAIQGDTFWAQYEKREPGESCEEKDDACVIQSFSLKRDDFDVSVTPDPEANGRIYFDNLGGIDDKLSRTIGVTGDTSSFKFCISSLGAVYQRPASGSCNG